MKKTVKFALLTGSLSLTATSASAQFKLPELDELRKKAPVIIETIKDKNATPSDIEEVLSKQKWTIKPKKLTCVNAGTSDKVYKDGGIDLEGDLHIIFPENPGWAGQAIQAWPSGSVSVYGNPRFECKGGAGQSLPAYAEKTLYLTPEQAANFRFRVKADLTHTPRTLWGREPVRVSQGTSKQFKLEPNSNWRYRIPPRSGQPQMVLEVEIKHEE